MGDWLPLLSSAPGLQDAGGLLIPRGYSTHLSTVYSLDLEVIRVPARCMYSAPVLSGSHFTAWQRERRRNIGLDQNIIKVGLLAYVRSIQTERDLYQCQAKARQTQKVISEVCVSGSRKNRCSSQD